MTTLRDLINRLQSIKDSGSFIQLSNFIEELEAIDAANPVTSDYPPVPPSLDGLVAGSISAGPNTIAEPGVEPLNAFGAAALALDIIAAREDETINPNFVDPDAAPDTTDTP